MQFRGIHVGAQFIAPDTHALKREERLGKRVGAGVALGGVGALVAARRGGVAKRISRNLSDGGRPQGPSPHIHATPAPTRSSKRFAKLMWSGRNELRPYRNSTLLYSLLILLLTTIILSACSTTGGILGGSWQPGALTHQHIRVLTVDTNNAQNIYAGDGQGTVFASSDAGQHWTSRSEGLPTSNVIHALSVDTTSQKLYLASDAGVFVSSDAAQHWHQIDSKSLPSDSYTALAFDLHNPHTIYVGSMHHAVLVSTDDGQTWTSLVQGLPDGATINNLTFDSDNHQLWAATSQGIYRYTVGTSSWQALNTGLPTPLTVYAVQPASVSGGAAGLIFAGTNQGFFRSEDAGAHWAESQESLAKTNVHTVFVDFLKPTTIYIGTDIGPLRSDDGGQQWGAVAPGFPRGQPVYAFTRGAINYAQLFVAADNIYLFPGTTGGINLTNLLPILLIVLFFYLLLRFNSRNRANKRGRLKPEQIGEASETDEERDNELS